MAGGFGGGPQPQRRPARRQIRRSSRADAPREQGQRRQGIESEMKIVSLVCRHDLPLKKRKGREDRQGQSPRSHGKPHFLPHLVRRPEHADGERDQKKLHPKVGLRRGQEKDRPLEPGERLIEGRLGRSRNARPRSGSNDRRHVRKVVVDRIGDRRRIQVGPQRRSGEPPNREEGERHPERNRMDRDLDPVRDGGSRSRSRRYARGQ